MHRSNGKDGSRLRPIMSLIVAEKPRASADVLDSYREGHVVGPLIPAADVEATVPDQCYRTAGVISTRTYLN